MWTVLMTLALAGDDPRISRSQGAEGGVVVLHPRVIPATEDPAILAIAADVEAHTEALVRKALPGVEVDVRPAPERV